MVIVNTDKQEYRLILGLFGAISHSKIAVSYQETAIKQERLNLLKKQSQVDLIEGLRKKLGKSMVFCQTRGGVSGGSEKTILLFLKKSIFQRVSRIILGPPKHVLHLVWSAYFISTAVRTALKVARTPQILGERRPVSKNNKIIFWRWDQV